MMPEKRLTHLSLFSGIPVGGIDLAAEWAGFETVAFVERDPFCQKVLAKHWPEVPIYDDVTTFGAETLADAALRKDERRECRELAGTGGCGRRVNATAYASRQAVHLLSGGFPCQPFSVAGKRKGAGDERFLWHEMLRIIREVEPVWVLGENVRGLLSIDGGRTFGTIVHELAEVGYRVGWGVYGACHVAAPHRRERVFIVAHSTSVRRQRCTERERGEQAQAGRMPQPGARGQVVGDSKELHGNGGWVHGEHAERDLPKPRDFGGPFGTGGVWEPEPIVGRVAHGVPHRVDRLRALGNAVVPQQVYPILKAIAEAIEVK